MTCHKKENKGVRERNVEINDLMREKETCGRVGKRKAQFFPDLKKEKKKNYP